MNGYKLIGARVVVGVVVLCSATNPAKAVPPPDTLRTLNIQVDNKPLASDSHAALSRSSNGFSSSGVVLLSQITPDAFGQGATSANEAWGYVSPSGREYGIIGLTNAVGFVEITNPVNPVIIGAIRGPNSVWRDMKVHGEYCYNVIESTGQGLEIFDLTNIDNGVVQFVKRTNLGVNMQTSHNIAYNPASGFLYLTLPNINGGRGLVALDTSDPINPVIAGSWSGPPGVRCHDAEIVTYTTGTYAGREIAFCFAENDGLVIADVTNKSNMFTMGSIIYPNTTYCHQGWLSEDRRYVFIGDEADENNDPDVTTTTTYVVDVQDLNNPQFVTSFTSGLPSIDHNMMVRGDFLYEANYSSGLRIFDISDVNNVTEVGFFDTYPFNDNPGFSGAWGVYPMLPSGRVLVGDGTGGLFVLDVSAAIGGVTPATPALPITGQLQYNRYLAFDPTTNGTSPSALRVTHQGPGGLASPKYVTAIGRSQTQIDENIFLLQDSPDFRVWTDPVCFVSDCILSPGNSYTVQSSLDGFVYSDGLILTTTSIPSDGRLYGDVVGSFDPVIQEWSPSDSLVTTNDILAIIKAFQLDPAAPGVPVVDIDPQTTNAITNSSDILSAVLSFQFSPYPFSLPDGCP